MKVVVQSERRPGRWARYVCTGTEPMLVCGWCAGDTGLLDHLLKHLADKPVTAEGDRLRRRHNADGHMEYWLQSATSAHSGPLPTRLQLAMERELYTPHGLWGSSSSTHVQYGVIWDMRSLRGFAYGCLRAVQFKLNNIRHFVAMIMCQTNLGCQITCSKA